MDERVSLLFKLLTTTLQIQAIITGTGQAAAKAGAVATGGLGSAGVLAERGRAGLQVDSRRGRGTGATRESGAHIGRGAQAGARLDERQDAALVAF